jgi:Flp pilus assembly protein TadD
VPLPPRAQGKEKALTAADPEALFRDGNRHLEAGDVRQAEARFREALRLAPDFAAAWSNLGYLLDQRGEPKEAEACYRRALALDPLQAQTHLNLGALLASQNRFPAAEVAYSQALLADPRATAAWSNLGVLYACLKREDEAEQCYRQALELDPDHARARFNLSYLLLRQGRFDEGWACFEARDWHAPLAAPMTRPRWRGEALAGKSLLILHEGGHGDMIQFSRYVPALKARGAASITLLCHPALKTLFATLEGVDEVVAFDQAFPAEEWDYWIPLLSLPSLAKTRLETIPAAIPYLRPDAERVARWSAFLPREGVRVGLIWKGNPRHENDADRSLPALELLAPLGTVPGVSFVSLQKGAGESEAARPPEGLRLVDLGSRMTDFADAAAIMAGLDLVISVDTAMAHLAGALGKPCWLLLPDFKTDWRWLKERTDSPWYPGTLRLFRQKTRGDWTTVIAEARAALEGLAQQ